MRTDMIRILSICGARPNFVKIAALSRAFAKRPEIESVLVHTGQHYDEALDRRFFEDLQIPRPEINLEVGSASHAVQTARVMERFEPVLLDQRPDAVLVVGDVNSTLACALVAAKLGTPVLHVEAGLRSFDRSMPEEINRIVTDSISDLLFVSERSGLTNLQDEGVDPQRVHFVGNVMIDSLQAQRAQAARSDILQQLGLSAGRYGVLTLHRPSNVDCPDTFSRILAALEMICRSLPIVFPMHPRTRANLARTGLLPRVDALPGLITSGPLGYIDFLRLVADAAVVLTDSGGIQEETTALGVPCLTVRENTERPATVEEGTNQLVGTDTRRIIAAFEEVRNDPPTGRVPELWDGNAAERIAEIIVAWKRAPAEATGIAVASRT